MYTHSKKSALCHAIQQVYPENRAKLCILLGQWMFFVKTLSVFFSFIGAYHVLEQSYYSDRCNDIS